MPETLPPPPAVTGGRGVETFPVQNVFPKRGLAEHQRHRLLEARSFVNQQALAVHREDGQAQPAGNRRRGRELALRVGSVEIEDRGGGPKAQPTARLFKVSTGLDGDFQVVELHLTVVTAQGGSQPGVGVVAAEQVADDTRRDPDRGAEPRGFRISVVRRDPDQAMADQGGAGVQTPPRGQLVVERPTEQLESEVDARPLSCGVVL